MKQSVKSQWIAHRRAQLESFGMLWDGITNPHRYDISESAVAKWYSLGKKCNLCNGPVYNQAVKQICQGCRADPLGTL